MQHSVAIVVGLTCGPIRWIGQILEQPGDARTNEIQTGVDGWPAPDEIRRQLVSFAFFRVA